MRPVIEVKGVHKSFKSVHAVRGVDLTINHGQFVALLGPNGAGKTTLVEMIEGIQHPDKGEILIFGKTWKENEPEFRKIIGLSLQETRFIDKLRVSETLALFAGFFGLGRQRVDEIINLTGLGEKRKALVVNLSGGQRQRLALGIALLNNPKILLLDEPTTGLDPNARREIWSILLKLKNLSDTSMILTTHYMEEAEILCDYIVIMDQGSILRQGSPSELLDEEFPFKTMEFYLRDPGGFDGFAPGASPFEISWDKSRNKGVLIARNLDKDLPMFIDLLKSNHLHLKDMELKRKTLDDLFTALTGRYLHE
jgi:ABC-2 type transport system ATP-binding protein